MSLLFSVIQWKGEKKKMKRIVTALAIPALLAALVIASEVKLEGVKCVVSGEPVNASAATDYKDGKVYFCCTGCEKSFKADTAKYSTKASHQLVATGQARQVNCPISGEPISADKSLEVSGAKVYFCCDNCRNQVAKASGEQQMNMVFGEAAWNKAGYNVAK